MVIGIELKRVRRLSGGRVHLTPQVPEAGPVVTLCSQSFAEGSYHQTGEEADCRNCLRRQHDPARVSSAFFNSDAGSELLQRSLEQARGRRQAASAKEQAPRLAARSTPPPRPAPAAGAAAAVPPVRGLRSRTPLRRTFEDVYTSPRGVILTVSKTGTLSHLTFDGPVDIRRRRGVTTIRAGDVVLDVDEAPGE